ncbi:MAG TPA: isoprenylcysteine carboxylmethyltransferase family protein [Gemmatimonadaceae bacterium]|jgi:protein-S-isoprenylcysteine O-methyltransferase Ste14
MITPAAVIITSWISFLVVWIGLSFFVKRDVRGGRSARAYQVRILVVMIVVILVVRSARHRVLHTNLFFNRASLFLPSLSLAWIGAVLTAIGVAVAIWARLYLGRNWSPVPARKEEHELVTGGPYAAIRHPIYTGIILAALGTALTGSIIGLCIFIYATTVFLFRVGKEERIMLDLFPDAYPPYQSRTKRLVPLLW